MGAVGTLLAVEDLGVLRGKATDGHPYQQWRFVLSTERGRWDATTGRSDFADRAKTLIGKRVRVNRGGKLGIVGGIYEKSDVPPEKSVK